MQQLFYSIGFVTLIHKSVFLIDEKICASANFLACSAKFLIQYHSQNGDGAFCNRV